MAATERVLISSPTLPSEPLLASKDGHAVPGLRISVRTTSSSFSDYPDWSLEEVEGAAHSRRLITDGACS
ncbi:MAG: hypothetical protein EBX52_03705 [Proteobacteria bacterium]|nr:hypothetical protein [Pseudomonadota bacterium]